MIDLALPLDDDDSSACTSGASAAATESSDCAEPLPADSDLIQVHISWKQPMWFGLKRGVAGETLEFPDR
jgi:hypothetical protein